MGNKICLVVDDSGVVRKVSRRMLEGMDFGVEEAANGKEAIDKCNQSMPDFILLDWNMPVMNGMEFLQQFKRDFGDNDTVIIFCTTEHDFSKIQSAIEAGANEYIMKPFDADILKIKLEQLGLM